MKFKKLVTKTGFALKKHSPALFTAVGIIGLGATAVLAYKSRDKVEAVIEDIEEARELNEEIDKVTVAKGIAEAVYLPVVVGIASAACLVLSHKIQNGRITALAGVVAVQQARNIAMESKYKEVHGEEAYKQFVAPVTREEEITTDGKGKEKKTYKMVKEELDKSIGQWYEDSSEYASDDFEYNMTVIESVNANMQAKLWARGHLLLNEVRDALGLERIRNGALVGWSTGDNFSIETVVTNTDKPNDIWVTWTTPKYIYDTVEFNGHYSII